MFHGISSPANRSSIESKEAITCCPRPDGPKRRVTSAKDQRIGLILWCLPRIGVGNCRHPECRTDMSATAGGDAYVLCIGNWCGACALDSNRQKKSLFLWSATTM